MSTQTLTLGPSHWTLEQIINDEMFVSVTGSVQTQGRTGSRWRLVLTYLNLTGTRRLTMDGHAFELKGRRNRLKVLMSNLGYTRSGAGGGTPLLNGGHTAGGVTLVIDGATAAVTNWLKGGDFLTIGNELKIVTQNCTTVAGATTINIWPELHANYADNAPVDITAPFGVYLLSSPISISGMPHPSDRLNESLVISLEEDVLA
jgi:hypothetical protein